MALRYTSLLAWLAAAALAALATGCADVHGQADAGPSGTGAAGVGSPFGDGAPGGSSGDALGIPPVDFTMGELGSAYKRGERIKNDEQTPAETGQKVCNTIKGVVRDFKGALPAQGGSLEPGGHPDFEVFEGRGVTPGLVGPELNVLERKPVYASRCPRGAPISPTTCPFGAMTTSEERFNQWYRSTEGVNKPFLIYFKLVPGPNGIPTFWSKQFLPMDGDGWGDNGRDNAGVPHNFGFTTEIHTTFNYMGGEHFTFEGDDDVWVFINGKLAVDLGGLHQPEKRTVDLDASATALGISKGTVYDLDLFHAERHGVDSNFHIELNFAFESCGYIVP